MLIFVSPGSCSQDESINIFSLINPEEKMGEKHRRSLVKEVAGTLLKQVLILFLRSKTRGLEFNLTCFSCDMC